ncbi:MAG: TetR/AcrR family transcriptional regulator [Clostridia bacterium]|nr:TetR/AcrR family transcriptional regulator [Clostridia bacterium]
MADTAKELINDEMSDRIIAIAEDMATRDGAHTVTVKRILNELGTANRVFYNRFHNLDEVLEIVYKNAVLKMHQCIKSDIDPEDDFFDYVLDVVINVLTATYDIKKQFARYAFEHDSLTQANYEWWTEEIKKIIEYGKSRNLIKDVDSDMLSYSIWCFCRGFNADAVGRNLSKEEAVRCFRFGFGCLIAGLKKVVE